jgi:hypothetical protein
MRPARERAEAPMSPLSFERGRHELPGNLRKLFKARTLRARDTGCGAALYQFTARGNLLFWPSLWRRLRYRLKFRADAKICGKHHHFSFIFNRRNMLEKQFQRFSRIAKSRI